MSSWSTSPARSSTHATEISAGASRRRRATSVSGMVKRASQMGRLFWGRWSVPGGRRSFGIPAFEGVAWDEPCPSKGDELGRLSDRGVCVVSGGIEGRRVLEACRLVITGAGQPLSSPTSTGLQGDDHRDGDQHRRQGLRHAQRNAQRTTTRRSVRSRATRATHLRSVSHDALPSIDQDSTDRWGLLCVLPNALPSAISVRSPDRPSRCA